MLKSCAKQSIQFVLLPTHLHAASSPAASFPQSRRRKVSLCIPGEMSTGLPGEMFTGFPGEMSTGFPGKMFTGWPSEMSTGFPGEVFTGLPSKMSTIFPLPSYATRIETLH